MTVDDVVNKIKTFVSAVRAKAADALAKGAEVLDSYASLLREAVAVVGGAQAAPPTPLDQSAVLTLHKDLDGAAVLCAAASGAQAAPWGDGGLVLKLIALIKQVVDALAAG